MSPERTIFYIDGYNLYHGLLDARLHSARWLDLRAMCLALLRPGQRLDLVRYFTTRVRGDPNAAARQAVFIDALLARGGIEIDYGHFLSKKMLCRSCGAGWEKNEEKRAMWCCGDATLLRCDCASASRAQFQSPITAPSRTMPATLPGAFPRTSTVGVF